MSSVDTQNVKIFGVHTKLGQGEFVGGIGATLEHWFNTLKERWHISIQMTKEEYGWNYQSKLILIIMIEIDYREY